MRTAHRLRGPVSAGRAAGQLEARFEPAPLWRLTVALGPGRRSDRSAAPAAHDRARPARLRGASAGGSEKPTALLRRFEVEAAVEEARELAGALADEAALALVLEYEPHALLDVYRPGRLLEAQLEAHRPSGQTAARMLSARLAAGSCSMMRSMQRSTGKMLAPPRRCGTRCGRRRRSSGADGVR